MSAKNLDSQGRWRNKIVAFRVSPEEDAVIEAKVQMSGLTKQDYITKRLMEREIVVQGNPRVFKGLKKQMLAVLEELERISTGENVSEDLLEIITILNMTMEGMKGGDSCVK